MDSYVCEWCGVLENKDEPVYMDNKTFCSNKCKKAYLIEHAKINLMAGTISFLDLPKSIRDTIDERRYGRTRTCAFKCIVCGTVFYSTPSNKIKCCSDKCSKIRTKQITDQNKLSHIGWTVHTWNGGISYGKYCYKFNNDLRNRVREFFENKCFLCGKPQYQQNKKLSVHHVNYDKRACCSDKPALFVPLCTSCHMKTNGDRKTWEDYFEQILKEKYNYKCYYTKEEYNQLKSEECSF
jgi:hypothetical protein